MLTVLKLGGLNACLRCMVLKLSATKAVIPDQNASAV